jgi:hypothetical protein
MSKQTVGRTLSVSATKCLFMKILAAITFTIIMLGVISSIFFVTYSGGKGVFLVLPPYLMMLLMLAWLNIKKAPQSSHIALLIAASVVCFLCASAFYGVTYNPVSSTGGLVFLVLPFYSIFIFPVVYLLSKWCTALLLKKDEEGLFSKSSMKPVLISLIVAVCFYPISFFLTVNFNNTATKYERRDYTNGDIIKAKELGVFVKSLHYKVDSFKGPVNFTPYIEKAFKYNKDSTKVQILEGDPYPYFIGFQRKAVKDAAVVMKKGQFEFSKGGPYLAKPVLNDTVIFEIKNSGIVLGKISVWD